MLAGLSFKASDIRIGLRYDGTDTHTGDGTGTFGWDAQLVSYSIFNVVSLSDGIQLSIESANSPSAAYIHSFAIPELGISDTSTGTTYETSVESYLILKDCQVIETFGSPWRLIVGSVEWWLNGSLFDTYAGGTLDGTGLGPGYVPLLGIPPRVTGALNPGATGYPISLPTLWQSTTDAELTAFYEFKPTSSDAWQSLPIAIITPTVPSCFTACQRCLSANGILTGSDTSAMTLNLSRSTGLVTIEAGGKYFTQGNVSSVEGSFWIVPNLSKDVVKLGGSYAALIERYGLPYTEYTGTRSCGPAVAPPPPPPRPSPYIETQTVTGEVHPEYTAFLGTVQAAAHVIEDPLFETSYVPMTVSNNAEVTQWIDDGFSGGPVNPALWPDPLDGFLVETVTYQFPSKTQNRTRYTDPNPDMPAYLDWSDGEASPTELNNVITYWSCVVHPHWLYWYHVQDWDVDGAPTSYDDYWGLLCDQQLYNAALPPSDNLLSRTSLVSAPMRFGGNQSFIETFVAGTKTSWWGVPGTNLRIDRPTIPTSVIATGPDRWTLTDCTASFGSTTVTATSTGASTIKLRYDLANWQYSPRMLTTLAKRFTIGWTATNIVSVAVKLIGIDGAEHTLTTVPGTFDWPLGLDNLEYAGTWAQDFGAGVVTDTGADLLPEGDSIAAMADNTRVVACQYLSARGAKYLELVVTVTNTANPVTLDLPVLVMPDPDWTVAYEGSQFGSALDPEGPGIRFGNVNYWNYLLDLLQFPPTVLSPTSKPTVIDWLSFRESVLLGNDPATNIDALIASFFESGVEYTLRKHLAYETASWWDAYSGGLQGIMFNSYCPPPLALFPGRARDSELTATTAWDQRVYSRTQHKRNYITPYDPIVQDLSKAPDLNWLVADTAPLGWSIASHTHPLDNDETDYVLSLDSKSWAEMRPWHGHFWVSGIPAEAMEPNAYAVSRDARHARGYIIGTTLRLGFSANANPAWTEVDTGITDVESLTMAWASQGQLNVLYVTTVEAGTAKLYTLDNESGALTLAITIGTATHAATDIGMDGVIRTYRLDGGTIYVRAYNANETALYAEQTTNLTGVDDAEIDVRHSVDANGKIRIGLLHFVSGIAVCRFSTDGITFA